ncbi:hypothetical protein IG631_13996 [Alternaria alternata]|nr:hypothetical protein IG631_13996 [Alternaria alternata]
MQELFPPATPPGYFFVHRIANPTLAASLGGSCSHRLLHEMLSAHLPQLPPLSWCTPTGMWQDSGY